MALFGMAWQVRILKVKTMEKYEFSVPSLYKGKVTADEAAAELERIREKHGILRPELVVDESREESAILHRCFQWDDKTAAESYRKEQARKLIDSIQVVIVNSDVHYSVRAFVNVRQADDEKRSYTPLTEAIHDEKMYADLLAQAKEEMSSFVTKYSQLEELNPVKAQMLKALAE